MGPGEQIQAQRNRGGVHCIQRFLQTQRDGVVLVQRQGHGDEALAQCLKKLAVAPLGGVGQGGAGQPVADAQMIELAGAGVEASHQVAQALAPGELGVDHAHQMCPCGKCLAVVVGLVLGYQMFEVIEGQNFEQLSKNRGLPIHRCTRSKTGHGSKLQALSVLSRRNHQIGPKPDCMRVTA